MLFRSHTILSITNSPPSHFHSFYHNCRYQNRYYDVPTSQNRVYCSRSDFAVPGIIWKQKNSRYSEITAILGDFSSQTPSLVVPNPQTPSTTTPALEMCQKPNNLTPKVENFENSPIITKTTSKIPSSSTIGPTDEVT